MCLSHRRTLTLARLFCVPLHIYPSYQHSVGREPSSAHVHEDFGTEKKVMFFFFFSLSLISSWIYNLYKQIIVTSLI